MYVSRLPAGENLLLGGATMQSMGQLDCPSGNAEYGTTFPAAVERRTPCVCSHTMPLRWLFNPRHFEDDSPLCYGTNSLAPSVPYRFRFRRRGKEGGVFVIVDGRSRKTIDPRVPTASERSTPGFHRPDRYCKREAPCGVGRVP